jgi:hypothetical protein
MVSEEGENPMMRFEAMMEEFLNMERIVEELHRNTQGGVETSVIVEGEG